MGIALRRIGRISQACRVWRIPKNLLDCTVLVDKDYGISFVGINPNIAGFIESYPVCSFQKRMGNEDIAEAKRIFCEGRITVHRAPYFSTPVEFNLPDGSTGGIRDKRVALVIENNSIRH